MATVPPPERRRPRPGSLERPVSGRLYRGTWLLVALPLLLAAFTVARPGPLPASTLPPAFDRTAAVQLAQDLALHYPSRVPGTVGAIGAQTWFREQLEPYGFKVQTEPFTADVPGRGRLHLVNLLALVPGDTQRVIVVMAHRDDSGVGPGANDNASGTAALIELARAYANPGAAAGGAPTAKRVHPSYTIAFLSTDGGMFGALGAADFARHSPYRENVVAVIDLDAIAGHGAARLEFAGDTPRSPAPELLATAAAEIAQETGRAPERPSALRQLIDLGFPFSLYEQAPFVARGIPAVTITTGSDRPPDTFTDTPARLDGLRLWQLGRAAQNVLDALDEGAYLAPGPSSYVFLGTRIVRGWAVELVLIAMLAPFLAAAVDLFARLRRRRIRIAPALRSYRSRLGFWLWCGVLFELFALVGTWGAGPARPPLPSDVGWPAAALAGLTVLVIAGWIVARHRLIPRRPIRAEEELAGYAGSLLVLGVIGLLVVATNPFALLFVLPAMHAWLWLPQVRTERIWVRLAVFAAGLAGPALLVGSLAFRYRLGFDALWYLPHLVALGYVPLTALVITLGWLAAGSQLTALVVGRYAPYPGVAERPPRGPLRETVRRLVLARRARLRASQGTRQALEG